MAGNNTVLVVTGNLFFSPRIQAAATASGMTSRMVGTKAEFDEMYSADDTAFVLIDLEADQETWREIVAAIKTVSGSSPTVIAYGPHTEVDLMAEARKLGCDTVLPKGAFVNELPEMFQTGGRND